MTKNLNDNYFGSGKHLTNAMNKYGKENFDKLVTGEWKSKEIMFLIENWIILPEFIKDTQCYNMKPGGTGGTQKGHQKSNNGNENSSENIQLAVAVFARRFYAAALHKCRRQL